jgi:hypothetical protein
MPNYTRHSTLLMRRKGLRIPHYVSQEPEDVKTFYARQVVGEVYKKQAKKRKKVMGRLSLCSPMELCMDLIPPALPATQDAAFPFPHRMPPKTRERVMFPFRPALAMGAACSPVCRASSSPSLLT